ncbi:hypothetical protein C8Q74DRAFT_249973 [Fomes fomentarius]|nr:hypothetical protein C8Q74DRAFT_249973 [Fomes fomentarius]
MQTERMYLPQGIAQSSSSHYMQYPGAGEISIDHQPMAAPTQSHFGGGSLDFVAPFGIVSPSTGYPIPHLLNDNPCWGDGGYYPATTPSSPVHSSAGWQAQQPLELDPFYHNSSSDFTRRRSTSEPTNYPPTSFSPFSSSDYTPQTQQLFATRRRNAAVPVSGSPRRSASKWECPYCPYVQQGRRNQDLRRHMETHTRSDVALWSCCGVPLSQSHHYGVPDATSGGLFIEDDFMVGGCQQSFSRKDALQRHLRERKGRCFGDPLAAWHPGNRKKVEM